MANAAADKKLKKAVYEYNYPGIIAAIQQGANPDYKNEDGMHVLTLACWYCKTDVVRALLEKGANPNIGKGAPLERTVTTTNGDAREILKLLIDHKVKINTQYTYQHGASALAVAIENGQMKMAEMLIAAGADLKLKDVYGRTPVKIAKEEGYKKLVQLMQGDSKPGKGKKPAEPEADPFIEKIYTGSFTTAASPHTSGDPAWQKSFKGKHFPGCGNPPVHLLTLDLSKIPEFPQKIRKLGKLPIVFHNCECDEQDFYDFKIGKGGQLSSLDDYEKGECEKGDYNPSKKISRVKLLPKKSEGDFKGIEVGGMPVWAQSAQWPSCPKCGDKSFFIAHIYQFYVPPSARGRGNTLNVFVCPDCKTESIVRQST